MKIKLISPQMSLRPMDSEYKRVLSPSISLLVLAGMTPQGHTVSVEDENARPLNLDDKPDLVGIAVNVDTSKRAYAIARHYRRKGVRVILGGIHASAAPEEALESADAVCIGEAENVWHEVLNDAGKDRLKRRYQNAAPADIAATPMPRWDLIDRSRYLYTSIVCSSRGCPFSCEFCYNSCAYVAHRYRNRPVEKVIAEIKALGTRHVMFIDDNFIGNITHTRELIQAMRPLGLSWHAAVSANLVEHPDLMDQLALSGCKSLFIGFESINQASIDVSRKRQNRTSRYEILISELHGRGIMINASMAFGFDSDCPDVFASTLEWLVVNKIETMTAHILTPYPGTALHGRLTREGRIVDHDYSHYNTSFAVFQPKNMTREQLQQGYLWIYDRFYSLENVWKRLPDCRKNRIPYMLFNLGYRKFGKVTSRLARMGLMHALGRLARKLSYGID